MTDDYKTGFKVPDFQFPPHPKGIALKGEDVTLAPLNVAEHAEALFAAYAQNPEPKDWLYLPYGPFDDFMSYRNWLESVANVDDPCFFTIIRNADNRPMGVVSFLRIDRANGVIEVGHINYSRELQRTSLATEAQFLLMEWVFENGYRRYEWKCDALNLRSRRSAERLGFSFEGVFRQAAIYKGRNRDTAWFAMIDQDWDGLKRGFKNYLASDNFDSLRQQKLSLSAFTSPYLSKTDDGTLDGR